MAKPCARTLLRQQELKQKRKLRAALLTIQLQGIWSEAFGYLKSGKSQNKKGDQLLQRARTVEAKIDMVNQQLASTKGVCKRLQVGSQLRQRQLKLKLRMRLLTMKRRQMNAEARAYKKSGSARLKSGHLLIQRASVVGTEIRKLKKSIIRR